MYTCEMIRQLNEVFCFTIRNWSITAHAFGHVRVIIYPAKRSQRLRRSRSETPIVAGRGKGYNRPSIMNTKRSKEIPEISTKRRKEITEISTKGR